MPHFARSYNFMSELRRTMSYWLRAKGNKNKTLMQVTAASTYQVSKSVGAIDDITSSNCRSMPSCICLASYDFLLVFYTDLRSTWICCQAKIC